ncbi:hypothetical protein L226DRAFT_529695 [Lentinus tigrinus ALCF2SS1-7]|uniref:DUF4050 domain-containing protein n=1 Tax=Lentinus tigrinus ALCF2SS1-6 TaxID=1328759 RepID=A0A5C2SWX9_9APHY|nr:hypothetical protein L227DRAFT_569491 [Lentinus tigrinus ALCF2SS1-6]RPD81289.1 hypothetical protein L226DRAFT_529695 [Lentinus tigrinus ALCF2SS1-7]
MTTPRAPFDRDSLSPQPTSQDTAMSPYQERLAAAHLPPPGPEYFNARRALWLVPGPNHSIPTETNSSRRRLEALLATRDALEDEVVWQTGVDRVWRGLLNGARLKHRLPLALILKILQAGWIREGTWPKGAIVPDSDDDASDAPLQGTTESPLSPMSTTTPYNSTPGPLEDESMLKAASSSNRDDVH